MYSTLSGLLWLVVAISLQVLATSLLPKTNNFRRWKITLFVLTLYAFDIYALSKAMVVLTVGVTYALWAGLGIVLVSLVGAIIFRNRLDKFAIAGIALIISGCITVGIFS